jgi:hypothetical protein
LAIDQAEEVIIALVSNPAIPIEVFDAVVGRCVRRGGPVAAYAASAPRITPDAASALLEAGFSAALARNQRTPAGVLGAIYRRSCARIREDVVTNESCPASLRRRAATRDRSRYVREAAARHMPPGDDPRIRASLSDLKSGSVVRIEKGAAGHAESFLMVIHTVGAVETFAYTTGADETRDYQVVTLTGTRRRVNGAPARRYPDPVTYKVTLSGIRIVEGEV